MNLKQEIKTMKAEMDDINHHMQNIERLLQSQFEQQKQQATIKQINQYNKSSQLQSKNVIQEPVSSRKSDDNNNILNPAWNSEVPSSNLNNQLCVFTLDNDMFQNDNQKNIEPIPSISNKSSTKQQQSSLQQQQIQIYDSSSNANKRYWDDAEHIKFLEACMLFGKTDIPRIAKFIQTRTPDQVRSHAQKYSLKLDKLLKEVEALFEEKEQFLRQQLQSYQNAFQAQSAMACYITLRDISTRSATFSSNIALLCDFSHMTIDQQLAMIGMAQLIQYFPLDMFNLNLVIDENNAQSALQPHKWGLITVEFVITSEKHVNINGQINAKILRVFCEALLLEMCKKILPQFQQIPVLVRLTQIYNQFIKSKDMQYFVIYNMCQALGCTQQFKEVAAAVFCLHVCAFCGNQ